MGRRRIWVHPILMERQALEEYRLVRGLHFHTDYFQMYIRLTKEQFESLLSRVGQSLVRIQFSSVCAATFFSELASPIGRAKMSSQRAAPELKNFQFGRR